MEVFKMTNLKKNIMMAALGVMVIGGTMAVNVSSTEAAAKPMPGIHQIQHENCSDRDEIHDHEHHDKHEHDKKHHKNPRPHHGEPHPEFDHPHHEHH